MTYYCYILKSGSKTYNGYTVDPKRRLRQHNGEIKGGAKKTAGKGPWEFIFIMTGFVTESNALSCEYRINKPVGNKRPAKYNGPVGRIKSLNEILNRSKWTAPCDIINGNIDYTIYIHKDYKKYLENIPDNYTIKDLDYYLNGKKSIFKSCANSSSDSNDDSSSDSSSESLSESLFKTFI